VNAAVSRALVEDPAVSLRAVRKAFGSGSGAVEALRSANADFGRGTFTAVMGPSASGKSTLLQVAADLDRPTAGEVLLAGHDLAILEDEHGADRPLLTAIVTRKDGTRNQAPASVRWPGRSDTASMSRMCSGPPGPSYLHATPEATPVPWASVRPRPRAYFKLVTAVRVACVHVARSLS
jgi:energy-coupling factor transporter ATP-binding protein EcfA2